MPRKLLAALAAGLTAAGAAAQSPAAAASRGIPASFIEATADTASGGAAEAQSAGRNIWVTGEYLLLFTRAQNVPLLAASVPAGSARAGAVPAGTSVFPLFPGDGKKLDFDGQSGVRGRVGTDFGTMFGIDGGVFFLQRKDAGVSLASNSNPSLALPYTRAADGSQQYLFTALPGQFGGQLQIQAETQLWGVDGNVRIEWFRLFTDRSELLAGFRHVNLEESIVISDRANLPGGIVSAVRDSFRTENQFYGPQMGFHGRLFGVGNLYLETIGTVALGAMRQKVIIDGGNSLTGQADETTGFYVQASNRGSHSRTQFALVGEGTVNLGYQITPNLRAHVGYTILYLSTVVRPGGAIDTTVNDGGIRYVPNRTTDTLNARPNFDFGRSTSDFFAQGLTLGLSFEF
jgi:hypothetical protein